MWSRRKALQIGGTAMFSFIAGCSRAGTTTENKPITETDNCHLESPKSPNAATSELGSSRRDTSTSTFESVTTKPEEQLSIGEWHTDSKISYSVTGLELLRTVKTFDGATYSLPENKQLVIITIGLRNLDTKIRTLLAHTFVCIIESKVFPERHEIYIPEREEEVDTGSLHQARETGYPGQWTAEGLAIDPEATAETFAVFVVPSSTARQAIQIGFDPGSPGGPYPVRWRPQGC